MNIYKGRFVSEFSGVWLRKFLSWKKTTHTTILNCLLKFYIYLSKIYFWMSCTFGASEYSQTHLAQCRLIRTFKQYSVSLRFCQYSLLNKTNKIKHCPTSFITFVYSSTRPNVYFLSTWLFRQHRPLRTFHLDFREQCPFCLLEQILAEHQ